MKILSKVFINLLLTYNIIASPIEVKPTNVNRAFKVSDYGEIRFIQDILRNARAAEMQAYLNENVNPCNNFYQFACSNFPKCHPNSDMIEIMANGKKSKLEDLLSSTNNATDTPLDTKLKTFFKSCMNIKYIANNYRSKLLAIIAEFGKMPVLSANRNWDEDDFDWVAMVAKMLRKYGKSAILRLDIAQDFRDNRIKCFYIGEPKLLFPLKTMYFDGVTGIYRSAIQSAIAEKIENFLGVRKQLAQTTAAEIMAFEKLLAQGAWNGRPEIDKMNTPTSMALLTKKYAPDIDVEKFLNLSVGVTQINCMYERVESFLTNLKSFLTQVPKHVVANYLFYKLINDEFLLRWETSEKAHRQSCVSKTNAFLSKAVDNMMYRNSNTKKLEDDIHLIFNHLRESLQQKFLSDELEWMKAKARSNAVEKVNELRIKIDSYAAENLTHEYKDIVFNERDYIENVKSLLLLRGKQFLSLLGEPPKPIGDASTSAASITPVYKIQENLIKVPVAALQPNFFWANGYPNATKFGNIGAILGHELVHGFDGEGRKFDKLGNNNNWWDLDTMQGFKKRQKCIYEQFERFQFGSSNLRSELILYENIADNGGIKLAYDAYMSWYNNSNRTEQELKRETFSNFNYTNTQIFFISYAQFLCADVIEILKDLKVATDTYAPNMYRVIGSLSNMSEFSAAFKCVNGSRMNPEKKCKIF